MYKLYILYSAIGFVLISIFDSFMMAQVHSNYFLNISLDDNEIEGAAGGHGSRMMRANRALQYTEGSCMINTKNYNKSCIYDKMIHLMRRIPAISRFSMSQVGPFKLIKLPEYASNDLSIVQEIPTSRSFKTNLLSLVSKSIEYFFDSYGIKIPMPSLTRNSPGIVIEEMPPRVSDWNEGRGKKKDHKRFAMVFPLIATLKFVLIKALLIPILVGIIAIKKMLLLAAMAIPTIIGLLRICRIGPGNLFGAGGLTAAAGAAAPLMAAPYVASDTIIGDFSNYAPSQQPYYNKQHDYGGKSFPSISPFTPVNTF